MKLFYQNIYPCTTPALKLVMMFSSFKSEGGKGMKQKI